MDVWQPAYPATEYGGLVLVYGPPGTEPLFPRFDIIDPAWNSQERGEDVVLRGMRLWGDYAVGMVKDCNWLQHYENIVDPYHLLMLHQWIRRPVRRRLDAGQGHDRLGEDAARRALQFDQRPAARQPHGAPRRVHRAEHVHHPEHPRAWDGAEAQATRQRTVMGRADRQPACARHQHRRLAAPRMASRNRIGSREPTRSPISGRARSCKRSYEERQRKPDDLEAQEGQRSIAIHALENLAHSDTGIVILRRLLREQLQRVEQGLDPINVIRDPSANKRIPTGAWNTILSADGRPPHCRIAKTSDERCDRGGAALSRRDMSPLEAVSLAPGSNGSNQASSSAEHGAAPDARIMVRDVVFCPRV